MTAYRNGRPAAAVAGLLVLAAPALAQDAAIEAAQHVTDNILRFGGALSYVLALLLAGAIGGLIYLLWDRDRTKDKAIAEAKAACAGELEDLRQAKDREIVTLKSKHADELLAMLTTIRSVEKILAGFRQDFQRLYDLGKERDDAATANLVAQVQASMSVAAAINAFPNAAELLLGKVVRQIMSELKTYGGREWTGIEDKSTGALPNTGG